MWSNWKSAPLTSREGKERSPHQGHVAGDYHTTRGNHAAGENHAKKVDHAAGGSRDPSPEGITSAKWITPPEGITPLEKIKPPERITSPEINTGEDDVGDKGNGTDKKTLHSKKFHHMKERTCIQDPSTKERELLGGMQRERVQGESGINVIWNKHIQQIPLELKLIFLCWLLDRPFNFTAHHDLTLRGSYLNYQAFNKRKAERYVLYAHFFRSWLSY